MPSLNRKIIQSLQQRLEGAKKIALLGVGSSLRGDDVAGLLVAEALAHYKGNKSTKFKAFAGETAPENLTGEIKRFEPSHVIIVDAVDTGKKPGTIIIVDPKKISGSSFCTHQLPISVLTDYLQQSIGCEIIIIGIQPKSVKFDSPCSKAVLKAAKTLAAALKL